MSMAANGGIIYIKADRNIEVDHPDVRLGDVLQMECVQPNILAKIKSLRLLKFYPADDKKQHREAVSILKVISCIQQEYPEIQIMFGQIYEQLTGTVSDGFTVLELTYSIGLVIGILTFFNHFGKKRFSVDPTPMEVEMRLYENDIQTTLIENISRKGKELDVDANSTGSHRT